MTRKSTPAHSENLVGADAGRLNEGVELELKLAQIRRAKELLLRDIKPLKKPK